MIDFSEKGAERRFEVPAWYIFQLMHVKVFSRIKIVLTEKLFKSGGTTVPPAKFDSSGRVVRLPFTGSNSSHFDGLCNFALETSTGMTFLPHYWSTRLPTFSFLLPIPSKLQEAKDRLFRHSLTHSTKF